MFRWLFLCIGLGPAAVLASENCMVAEEMDASLVDWYGERVVAQTETGDTVLWQNDLTGSWTVVEYHDSGLACVLGFGDPQTDVDRPRELMAMLSI